MVDIETAARSTYARASHAKRAQLVSALAIPVIIQSDTHLQSSPVITNIFETKNSLLNTTVPIAVIILYLDRRLETPTHNLTSSLSALTVSQVTPSCSNESTISKYQGDPPISVQNSNDETSPIPRKNSNEIAEIALANCVATGVQAALTGPLTLPIFRSFSSSPEFSSSLTDRKLAAKLSGSSITSRRLSRLCPCPICFATIDHAVIIRACAHNACADCLKRWRVLSPNECPSCGGIIDHVSSNPELDEYISEEIEIAAERARNQFFYDDDDDSDTSVGDDQRYDSDALDTSESAH
eukprot:CAMPEP_0197295960 /NCGR_PEP_ID=MMETSP0890-20130614/37111_1 /TAXON_ID=44058 ORGANISM="Aureoumbra lagunensis, Strain CCMP1510" /NCGR_SAMPLE_ID=MMETSP0890 /ASSEMBLY_ACC=CAM_ASM_000533 /LENGTH=296 /DNA_ID=CAMNT_0042772231 /DNA_START=370 /DNA_END=1260 /DNA_ORIENTATION=+